MNYNMFENNHELEISSGCESGWTLYLENSSFSSPSYSSSSYNRQHNECTKYYIDRTKQEDEDEDEDMSMVSDASSGPPHLHDQQEADLEIYGGNHDTGSHHHCPAAGHDHQPFISINKKQNKEKRRRNKSVQQHSTISNLLDDTASSPFFDFSNKSFTATRNYDLQPYVENVLEYSQGYSTTQFQVRPPYDQDRYDFYQASTPPNQLTTTKPVV